MYLHQGLIDILFLQTYKLTKLQSCYTYSIVSNNITDTIDDWKSYNKNPNTVSRLRYLWNYYSYKNIFYYNIFKWNYILGV